MKIIKIIFEIGKKYRIELNNNAFNNSVKDIFQNDLIIFSFLGNVYKIESRNRDRIVNELIRKWADVTILRKHSKRKVVIGPEIFIDQENWLSFCSIRYIRIS